MTRLALLFVVFAAAAVFADGWAPRSATFRQKQAAERKRLGLDEEKAAKAYPTPEVFFGASWACPGETSTVLLQGKLQPGTLVGTPSQSVEIVKEELTPRGWQATVKVKPGTKDRVTLQVIAPVSGITNTIDLPIGCPHVWVLELQSGDRLQLQVVEGEGRAPGEWSRGGKPVESRTFSLSTDGKLFTLSEQETAEDRERVKRAQEAVNSNDVAARQQELTQKMQACSTLPMQQMGPCIQQYSGELQKVMAATQSAAAQSQAAMAPRAGCRNLSGTIAGTKLTGNGNTCANTKGTYEQVPFTGVIR